MIPPRVQTKGCVAYARAASVSSFGPSEVVRELLTLMCRILDHFRHHGLHNGNITVERTADESCKQRDPIRLGQAEHDARHGDTEQTNESDRFPAVNVRDHAPPRGGDGLCDGVGRDEQS
jgi:hypothetical protein